ncbi:MAG: matrixin family metalloprotease [Candidatus Altiarchaeota archaeon]
MNKKVLIGLFISMVFLQAILISAKPVFQAAKVTNPVTGEVKNIVTLPAKAVEAAPNIYYLGQAQDNGRPVEGYAIVHYKDKQAKPATTCGNGVCEPGENAKKCPQDCGGAVTTTTVAATTTMPAVSSCYGFLARGTKWRTAEPYIVDASNTRGLDEAYVSANLASDIGKWESAASADILGGEVAGVVDGADTLSTDGKNEVYFADVAEPGAIAITIVWGVFRGPPSARELVEWDQVYDQVDYDWSATGEADKMDFESIATHELGHSVGLDDLYTVECVEQTMYGYADFGETNKRSLESGDTTGVKELYR